MNKIDYAIVALFLYLITLASIWDTNQESTAVSFAIGFLAATGVVMFRQYVLLWRSDSND